MKTVHIDSEFKCHTTNPDGTFREIETSFFDGKCQEFVEGYRFVPSGESWTREDGEVFYGEMVTPWKDFNELDNAQREYERTILADAENALAILLGGAV
jgi:hypothetical protein